VSDLKIPVQLEYLNKLSTEQLQVLHEVLTPSEVRDYVEALIDEHDRLIEELLEDLGALEVETPRDTAIRLSTDDFVTVQAMAINLQGDLSRIRGNIRQMIARNHG